MHDDHDCQEGKELPGLSANVRDYGTLCMQTGYFFLLAFARESTDGVSTHTSTNLLLTF